MTKFVITAYDLCKFMNNILKKVTVNNEYNIKNSYEFREFITSQVIPDNHKLVSYDAKSLYTNTNIDTVIEDLKENWTRVEEHTNIDKELFFEILNFCLCENVYFTYKDKTYRQRRGLAMGLSLACTIADIFLTKMFDSSLPKLTFKPAFVKKFIDDIISTAPEDKVPEVLTTFNSFDDDHKLEFTDEIETENKINFLDMTLIHMNNNKVKTNWYAKESTSERIMNYLSAHPPKMKEKVAMELVNRILSLSDPIFKPKNKERIKAILTKNNYPKKVIYRALATYEWKQQKKIEQQQQTSQQQQPTDDTESEEEKTKIYRGMSYIPKLSEAVNKQLRIAIPELTVAPKPTKQLQTIFTKTKTKIPKEERTNAIYRIDCKEKLCPEPFYLGETERTPKKRGTEHKRDYNNRFAPGYKSALIKHTLDYPGHAPDVEPKNIKILGHEENEFKRKFMESCYINLYGSKSNNYKRDANRLHSNYGNILEIYKKINAE